MNPFHLRGVKRLPFLLLLTLLTGCATYQYEMDNARSEYVNGRVGEALKFVETPAKTSGKDQLAYLLDYATLLQLSGDYKNSTQYFLIADAQSEYKDYHSVSKNVGSLLFNEGMVQYKGENFEKVLINGMLGMNFLLQDNLEGALVEARRANEKIDLLKINNEKKYTYNEFALYVSALAWEANGNWDDAYIAYNSVYQLDKNAIQVKRDLLRTSYLSKRWKSYSKMSKELKEKARPEWKSKDMAEVVLVFQQGWAPRKGPSLADYRIPQLYPVGTRTRSANLIINGEVKGYTEMIYSVEEKAAKTFNDQIAALVAKRLAAIAAKKAVAKEVSKENEGIGLLLSVIMHASDQADIRQWYFLPESFQVARFYVKAGKARISSKGVDSSRNETGETMPEVEVNLKPGQKKFLMWRSVH